MGVEQANMQDLELCRIDHRFIETEFVMKMADDQRNQTMTSENLGWEAARMFLRHKVLEYQHDA